MLSHFTALQLPSNTHSQNAIYGLTQYGGRMSCHVQKEAEWEDVKGRNQEV